MKPYRRLTQPLVRDARDAALWANKSLEENLALPLRVQMPGLSPQAIQATAKREGAFYVLPKIPNPKRFVWDMFDKKKVITYLGEWFGAPDRVRFSYALDVDKIEEGLNRVGEYLK